MEDDSAYCNEGKSKILTLKMSSCSDDQFTCSNGDCVRMEERCDQVPNCEDDTDEMDCGILVLKNGYNKEIPPTRTVSVTNQTIVPVPVNVSIQFYKIVGMEEISHSIEFQFKILLVWKEHRASYNNIKKDSTMNILKKEDISMLWLPLVMYSNTDKKETTRLGKDWEWDTDVTVIRENNHTRNSLDELDEVNIYRLSLIHI